MTANLDLSLTAIVAVFLALTSLAVLLRCYVRLAIQKRFAADDYLILFSQTNFCAFMYCVLQQVEYGLGKHRVEVLMTGGIADFRMVMKVQAIPLLDTYRANHLGTALVDSTDFLCLRHMYGQGLRGRVLLLTGPATQFVPDGYRSRMPLSHHGIGNRNLPDLRLHACVVLLGALEPALSRLML